MKVEIRYAARYAYEERVTFSPHLFRLIPKVDSGVKLRRFDFRTNTGAVVNWRRDLFENEVASVFYPRAARDLDVKLRLKLEVEPKNAFGFLLATRALQLPFAYDAQEQCVLAPYLSSAPALRLEFWRAPVTPQPTVPTLVALNEALHKNLGYERRDEGAARGSAETLQLGRGACRDFAVLLVETLRGLGLAARYASGYLCEFGSTDKRAEGALHAWVEVYLPGAGWVGLDPTNGTLCDHHHLTAAVGLGTEDVAPVVGSYFHATPVPHEMSATLEIIDVH
ncbi:MAG: transglutaminase family protein [Chthoniobacteraceae bacterium]